MKVKDAVVDVLQIKHHIELHSRLNMQAVETPLQSHS